GEGFRAIHRLLGSAVEYRRMDAFELGRLEDRFDLIYCWGILHRVENPLGLLRVLRGRTASGGSVLVETYGVRPEERDGPAIRVSEPGEVYARDEFVYWGFGHTGLERLARSLQRPLDGLETDCCLTADGGLVLLHDPLLEVGTTLSGWAHERTAAEIRAGRLRHSDGTPSEERPLLLDELLELAPPDVTL